MGAVGWVGGWAPEGLVGERVGLLCVVDKKKQLVAYCCESSILTISCMFRIGM